LNNLLHKMKSILLLLIFVTLHLVSGQYQRLVGTWNLESCSCSGPDAFETCTTFLSSAYTLKSGSVGQTDATSSIYTAVSTDLARSFGISIDVTNGIASITSLPYICSGPFVGPISCVNQTTDTPTCTFQFQCVEGECITTIQQLNVRRYAIPSMMTFFSILALILAFTVNNITSKQQILAGLAIAEIIFGIVLLWAPPAYIGLAITTIGAITVFLLYKQEKPVYEKYFIAAFALWIFFTLGGLNVLAQGSSPSPYFEVLMTSFNQGTCTLNLGLSLLDPRCQGFLIGASVLGEFVLYLQVFIIMISLVV